MDLWRNDDLEKGFQTLGTPSDTSSIAGSREALGTGGSPAGVTYPGVIRTSPGSFSRLDFSAERSIRSCNHTVMLSAATSRYYERTCSAPFSFSGRLRTRAFVKRVITKLSPILKHTAYEWAGPGAYLGALSKKFRRYFLLSTSGTIASVIDSRARKRSPMYGDCPVTSSWFIHVVRVSAVRAGSHTASSSRRRATTAVNAALGVCFRQNNIDGVTSQGVPDKQIAFRL
jgi:hypothetical protein